MNRYANSKFDIDTGNVTLSDLTTLKGGVPVNTDYIYIYNGAKLTIQDSETLHCLIIVLGDISTGAALSGQKYGIIQFDAGSVCIFKGDVTNTNSGIKSSPTTPDSSSKLCQVIVNGTSAKHVTFNNSVGANNTNNKYNFYLVYGVVNIKFADVFGSWYTVFSPLPQDTSKTLVGPVINDTTVGPLAANSYFAVWMGVEVDLPVDLRRNTLDTGTMGSNGQFVTAATAATSLKAGGSIDIRDCSYKGATAIMFTPISHIMPLDRTYYFGKGVLSYVDNRSTKVIPTGLAIYDLCQDGELRAVISNIASYADTDVIKFYNNAGDVELGACSKARYVSRAIPGDPIYSGGYAVLPALTNGTTYTVYARATSDNNTYSDKSVTAQGTPTAPVKPAITNVRLGIQYGTNGTELTGTLRVPQQLNIPSNSLLPLCNRGVA